MKPMFLPDVENNPQPGPYRALIEQMQGQGAEYPQIWHLFAYLPSATDHLARFTQARRELDARLDSSGIRHAEYVLDQPLDLPLRRLFGARDAAEYA